MSKTTVTFNGTNLNDLFVVSDLVRPFMMRTIETTEVDGRDGAIYRSARYNPIDITMRLTFLSSDKKMRVMALANLVKVLDVDEPTPLYISDDDGWYYLAIPKGGDISRWVGAESFPLTFTCPDPARYGAHKTETLSVNTGITVGGNFDTPPKLTYSITPTATGYATIIVQQRHVPYDPAKHISSEISLKFPDSALRNVIVDCASRTVTAKKASESSYSVIVPTVRSEFPILKAGKRVFLNAVTIGSLSGSVSMEYDERWL